MLLQRKVKQFSERVEAGLPEDQRAHAFRLHNRDFHHHLYAVAHSDIVSTLAANMSDRADLYLAAASGTKTFGERFWEAVEEHRRIAEVLTWRDGPAFRRVIETHVVCFIEPLQSGGIAKA